MNKTAIKAVVMFVTLASIALAGAASVKAADPRTIGGKLSADPSHVTLLSQGTLPIRVVLSAESVTLAPVTFDLQPGETGTANVTGEPRGRVTAHLSALVTAAGQDTSSVTLTVSFAKPAPPDYTPIPIALLLLLGVALLIRRIRPWELRMTRRS